MHRWVVGIACIALGACILQRNDTSRDEAVIAVLCACEAPALPKAQELCVEDLKRELGEFGTIRDRCAQCILANSNRCATLLSDCRNACGGPIDEPGF
ncbi:MAG: hypothetical protein KF773_09975 [Deltaproteobacteria bacterium]|nr:hypothetical protein [Deltaproteobacteria bacterium]